MGRIPDEDVARVRDATDIVQVVSDTVVLKKKGRLLWGNCPFHAEKTPSFKIDPATQLWHCFGCGLGGDVFGFVMRSENLEFPDAVRQLAERGRIEIHEEGGTGLPAGRKERLVAACDAAAAFYHGVLTTSKGPGATKARDYLQARGFGSDVAKRFRLGYAAGGDALTTHLREKGFSDDEMLDANLALPDDRGGRLKLRDRFYDRIVFPIYDLQGKAVGFGGRVLGDAQPKYLNTGETPVFHKSQNLYAIHWAKNEIVRSGEAVVVEGYTDAIALHEAGIGNTVATLGTALTPKHVRLLSRFASRVVYLFDGDAAGVRAALRAADLVDWKARAEQAAGGVEMHVALVPEGKDPADWVTERGADAMREVIGSAVPLLRFVLDQRLSKHDLTSMEGRSTALASAAGALAAVRGTMLEHEYSNYVADRLKVHVGDVQRTVASTGADLGGGAVEEEPVPEGVVPIRKPVLAEEKAAWELVRLIAHHPDLRSEARELLVPGVLGSPVYEALAREILSARDAHGAELFEKIGGKDPEMGALLSGILLDTGGPAGSDSTLRAVMSKLEESDLERRILAARAEMKALDPASDAEKVDRLFREAAGLQRELDAVRRRVRTDTDDSE